jgi:ketosteroid isomerase-like protein
MSMAYWESDSLLFIGSKGITVGYGQTLQNYTASYPDRNAMGTLTFVNRSWKPLGGRHALLIGAWHLERKGEHEPLSGHYSLVWRKEGRGRQAKWVIITDHSS